ncbi:hypothetical protein [Streptomyces antarcticus]|uniref:hypothetical protein n=1 Tax=Streptomyces antarcticus TaxID=2996458 RepID=UPI00226D860E|nr:hypothetical protein [Streptomyces sp. H34-AA3]
MTKLRILASSLVLGFGVLVLGVSQPVSTATVQADTSWGLVGNTLPAEGEPDAGSASLNDTSWG